MWNVSAVHGQSQPATWSQAGITFQDNQVHLTPILVDVFFCPWVNWETVPTVVVEFVYLS